MRGLWRVFGGKVGSNAKQYSHDSSKCGFRLFDFAWIAAARQYLEAPTSEIASARERTEYQLWADLVRLDELVAGNTAPRNLNLRIGADFPIGIAETLDWLKSWDNSGVTLDSIAAGKSEGVVIRNKDRSKIAKLRFEDYARTLKFANAKQP